MKKKLLSLAIAGLLVLTMVGSAASPHAAASKPPGQKVSHCQPPTQPPACSGKKP